MITSPSLQSMSPSLVASQPIDINQDASVDFWTAALSCTELELRVAVAEVGSLAGDVGSCLGRAL